jgi:hypothetical protein
MSIQGPVVVVAEKPAPELANALAEAGAFPVVEALPSEAMTAFAAANPAAIVLADAETLDHPVAFELARLTRLHQPLLPVMARVAADRRFGASDFLPVAADTRRLIGRLQAALRIRAAHATLVGRTHMLTSRGVAVSEFPVGEPLDDATILVAGRGRSHPALSVAVGGHAALVGALSLENAAKSLKSRDVDGIVIGDGFSPKMVDAFLSVLAEDSRFRDLPVSMLGGASFDFDHELPNFSGLDDPEVLVDHLLPYVRLHAHETRVRRMLQSLDTEGLLDPDTGLMKEEAFLSELNRATRDSGHRGVGLSIARFAFPDQFDRRATVDAARLVSRLVRGIDFGCRDDDGSIVVVFTETDLRHAHVVARRIASVLKHTMLHPGDVPIAPSVTLATMKSSDNVASLMARVAGLPVLAAE